MKRVFIIILLVLPLSLSGASKPAKPIIRLLRDILQIEKIHPDSVHSYIQRVEDYKRLASSPQERTIASLVLGRLYYMRSFQAQYDGYEDYMQRSLEHYRQVFSQPQLLARMKAKQWMPLLKNNAGNDAFGGDMLSVAWYAVREMLGNSVADTLSGIPTWHWMISHYTKLGNQRAAFYLAEDSLMHSNIPTLQLERELHKLLSRYSHVPDVARLYIYLSQCQGLSNTQRKAYLVEGLSRYPKYKGRGALENELLMLTDPSFSWTGQTLVYPAKQYEWEIAARNMHSVSWGQKLFSLDKGQGDTEWLHDTVLWRSPDMLGRYTLKFQPTPKVKTKDKVRELTQQFFVTRLQLLVQSLPADQLRLLVVDRETGAPRRDVQIEQYDHQKAEFPQRIYRTDAMGSVKINVSKSGRYYLPIYVRLHTDQERQHTKQRLDYGLGWYNPMCDSVVHTELYTDRAIYRPGQEVRVGGIRYVQQGWKLRVQGGDSIVLVLRDAQFQVVEQKCFPVDSLGTFEGAFYLPTDLRSGMWNLQVQGGQVIRLRVEQYKRPTFTVVLDDSLQHMGKQLKLTGCATRFDGVPLRNACVVAHVKAHNAWSYSGLEEDHRDTVSTDASGRFSLFIPQDTTKVSLFVRVDVLGTYGEQQQAQHTYVLRTFDPRPDRVDSTFLLQCACDSFDAEHPTQLILSTTHPEAWVYYTLSANGSVQQDTLLHLTGGQYIIPITYKEEYGTGAVVSVATTLGERVYIRTQQLRLSKPDMRLRLRWDAFRDLTQPGSREQWRLTLMRPDGQPAQANILSTLYDASLDRLQRHHLSLDISLNHWLRGVYYQQVSPSELDSKLNATYMQKRVKDRTSYAPMCLDPAYFEPVFGQVQVMPVQIQSPRLMYKATRHVAADAAIEAHNNSQGSVHIKGSGQKTEKDETVNLPLRDNFQETAYFAPRVRTNTLGQAIMEFTLPQSTTTWRLQAVAHTADMLHHSFTRDLVAQKPLMAQARLPRFLRAGDQAVLRGSLTNITDTDLPARVTMQVLDARTQKELLSQTKRLNLPAHCDTTLSFTFSPAEQDIIVRWSVHSKEGSDGEQHLLRILPATKEVINSMPITAMAPGEYVYDLQNLIPQNVKSGSLVVEYTSHPEQLALQALPALCRLHYSSALDVASAYYARVLAKHLDMQCADSTEVLMQRLHDMQCNDGGIAWYPGMPSSRHITLGVGFLLTRLTMLTDQLQDDALLRGMIRYLLNEDSRVREMSLNERLRTLYVLQGTKVELSRSEQAKADSLYRMVKALDPATLDVEAQALSAIVLERQGMHRKAQVMADAFRSRLVTSPQRGTYIEYHQGPSHSIDSRLCIHVQLMEALQYVLPQAKELDGMRQYLLLRKRTQLWDTPLVSANAIFALMNGYKRQPQVAGDVLQLSLQDRRTPVNIIAPADTLGYVCDTVYTTRPKALRLHKVSQGQSWGAAYACFRQPYTDVTADTTGLAVRQSIPENVRAGSRITLTQRIMADTDYEFVTLVVSRPANLEPVDQLSGCRWQDGICYYLELTDSELRYHILSLPRGHFRLKQDYYVERPGNYHTGVSTIHCTLAPEFQGRDADHVMCVTP